MDYTIYFSYYWLRTSNPTVQFVFKLSDVGIFCFKNYVVGPVNDICYTTVELIFIRKGSHLFLFG